MRALFLLLTIASVNLRADAIGTAFTATSCSIGAERQADTSGCDLRVVIDQVEYEVAAHASASANGMPWTIQYDTSPDAELQPPTVWSAYSRAVDSGVFATPGNSRIGRVQFDIVFGASYLNNLSAFIGDGTNSYYFNPLGSGPIRPIDCNPFICEFQGELPLLLGFSHSFTVTLGGSAATGDCQGGNHVGCTPFGNATMTFAILESNRTTPVPFSPVSPVPEPANWALACVGLLGASAAARRFRS